MQHFYFLLGLGALLSIAFIFSLVGLVRNQRRLPYRADAFLFSPEQRAFQAVLERAVGPAYRIYGKVAAVDLIETRGRLNRRARERAEQRLAGQVFDFLVCVPETSALVCAVNLGPRSRLSRRPPKTALDAVCAAAKLPFVCFRQSEHYSVVDIEEQVFAAMHRRRPVPESDDVSVSETEDALNGLTQTIGDRDSGPTRSERPAPVSRAPRKVPIPIKPQTRTEPRLQLDEDLDIGPEFRIRVEDDEALKLNRFPSETPIRLLG